MRVVWTWPLVDIPHYHDRHDALLFSHDAMAWDGFREGLNERYAWASREGWLIKAD
jgi:hypothetical protein